MLHGELQQVNLQEGIRWSHPDLMRPVDFRPDNLAWIRFEGALPVQRSNEPSVNIRFQNGDEVLGNLIGLDEKNVKFSTWFNEQLSAPRDVLQSLSFLSPGFRILYEGPTSMNGWRLGRDPKAWKYRDGVFISEGVGVLGRDFGMILESLWDQFWVTLGSFRNHFGITAGSLRGHSGMTLGNLWDDFGETLG